MKESMMVRYKSNDNKFFFSILDLFIMYLLENML